MNNQKQDMAMQRDVTVLHNVRCVKERPNVIATLFLQHAVDGKSAVRYDIAPMLDTVPMGVLPRDNSDEAFGPLLTFFTANYVSPSFRSLKGIKVPRNYSEYRDYRTGIVEQLGDEADDVYVDGALDNWSNVIARRQAAVGTAAGTIA